MRGPALPNSLHAERTIAALQAGKPALCEKPLTGSLVDFHFKIARPSTHRCPLLRPSTTCTPTWASSLRPSGRGDFARENKPVPRAAVRTPAQSRQGGSGHGESG
jgi:hypothetical protein